MIVAVYEVERQV